MTATLRIAALAVAVGAGLAASARAAGMGGPSEATAPLQIALRLGEDALYRFGGEGFCRHAASGAIHGAPAALWSVRQAEARRSLSLSFWRVEGQGDMLTLGISLAGESHRVNTVRIGTTGQLEGAGRATFTPSGHGGTFSIAVVASDGTPVSGTITCGRFTPIVEEGG